MSKTYDGGLAFPLSERAFHEGMSLRDYVAVHALAAIIRADGIQFASNVTAHAIFAFEQADAFLAAREERS